MRRTNVELRWWLAAIVCFAAFAVLGTVVSVRTPTRIDVEAVAMRGSFVPLAAFFTSLGRWFVLAPVAIAAAIVALALRANVLAIAALMVSQLVSQGVVAMLKGIFHRTRPDYWLVQREADLSYPSGHAVTTVVFYVALALLVWRTTALPRPVAIAIVTALGIAIVGIPWSRLALGAHYLTDVIGGLLFGAGWLFVTLAILTRSGVAAR